MKTTATEFYGWLGIIATTGAAFMLHEAVGLFVMGAWALGLAFAAMELKKQQDAKQDGNKESEAV